MIPWLMAGDRHPLLWTLFSTNWLIGLCALAILFGVIKLVKSH